MRVTMMLMRTAHIHCLMMTFEQVGFTLNE
jgi:hypothetical protein